MVKRYQDVLRRLWVGRCTIFVLDQEVNKSNGQTETIECPLASGEPCRLSFQSGQAAQTVQGAAQIGQSVKLFLSSGVEVPPGSKIVVTQNGAETAYIQSGEPARYSTHQEIPLELFRGWA